MCAGALSHARVSRVVWGVRDPKFGGCVSLGGVLSDERLNHRAEVAEGVRADQARELLRSFFQSKRG
jgi:tRNA(adenine34) deaminase